MKQITIDRIQNTFQYYEGSQVQATGNGCVVLMPYGRRVNIHPGHIDFRGFTKLVPGETERELDDLKFELMTIAQEELGVVSLISCRPDKSGEGFNLWLYGKIYKLNMEGAWWPFSVTLVQKHFGDGVSRKLQWGGYRIDAGNGKSAIIGINSKDELIIKKAVGTEMMEASIGLVNEVQGRAVVAGSPQNILLGMAVAQSMGVEAIPELYFTQWQHTKVGMLMGFIGVPIAVLGTMTYSDPGKGMWWAFGILVVISMLYQEIFMSNRLSKARERGQSLTGSQPASNKRKSDVENLRAKGML